LRNGRLLLLLLLLLALAAVWVFCCSCTSLMQVVATSKATIGTAAVTTARAATCM
jgi:hypothetical protein